MIQFEQFQLDNGLKVIVHEDPSTTLAVLDVIYDVGSRDEKSSKTGFAHLFEHLMFGGSENIPEFDTPLQRVGGENNAFTTPDLTNYYISVPYQNLETAFWLESDRMKQLAFNPQSLEVQRKVVIEEFKQRYLNQPYGDVWLKWRPIIYKKHPYQWPTIGADIKHIEEATLEDVKEFFNTFYNPSNAILVVAGRVKLDEVKLLCEKWFAPIASGKKLERNLPQEEVLQENTFLEIKGNVPANCFYMAFPVVGRYEKPYHSIDLISDLLGRGDSSFLFIELVQKLRIFDSISAYMTGSMDPGLLVIQGSVCEGITYEKAMAELYNALDRFLVEGISEKSLQKVKNQAESSLAFMEVEVLNKAMNLAIAALAGDANGVNLESEKINSVTLDDIRFWSDKLIKKDKHHVLWYQKNQ